MKVILVYIISIVALYIIGVESRAHVEKEYQNEQMHVL